MNSNWVRIPKLRPIHYWGRYDTAHHNETRYKLDFQTGLADSDASFSYTVF